MTVRVLMLGPRLDVKGGISSVERILLRNWCDSRFEIKFCPTTADGSRLQKVIYALCGLIWFLKELLTFRPQLLHIHFSRGSSFYRKSAYIILGRLLRRRIILHAHSGAFHTFYEHESGGLRKSYIRWILNMAHALIVLSPEWESFYKRLYHRGYLVVIGNPVEEVGEGISSEAMNKPSIVLFMGKLCREKGTYDLLRAFSTVSCRYPNAELWLAGVGEVEEVKRMIAETGRLVDKVRLLGWIEGVEKIHALRQATVFVLPSYYEGLPVALLEAMAAGVPVITTPVGGIPSVLTDEETGLLVNPGAVKELEEALCRLLGDEQLRHRLGESGRKRVLTSFGVTRTVAKIACVYDGALRER